ncbi:TonB-dependent receptor plug domain-containing protein [Rubrivirga sp. IMCC45206]|uniref:TonB-dependent receptor plug domain-containing protein n=1 Tax=Rubrivirga sp. IMCC45206 TaxID=3391614 RepID=UPI0039902032
MSFRRPLLAALLAAALTGGARAQAASPDTVRALQEVVVGGAERATGVTRIPVASVLARDPESVADLARLVPSAAAPTNSRGQTLLAIRGVGERQTAVSFDGAPLTDSWDRRVDLGLIPAGVVAAVDVASLAPLGAGPNAAGGTVDLTPRTLDRDGALTEAEISGGLPARGRLAATSVVRRGAWQATVAGDAGARSGSALATPLPFSQPDGALRTNTDRRAASGLLRVARQQPGWGVAATVLHVAAAQGVAPEGHLDPAEASVRFWRVPDWRRTLAVVRARDERRALRWDATAHAALATEAIQPFTSADYADAETLETRRERSVGGRFAVEAGDAWTLRALGSGLWAAHRRDEGDAREPFGHGEGRVGAEAEGTIGGLAVLAGVALDAFVPTETAGRESSGAFWAPALTARVAGERGGLDLHAGLAHAARFPTMRELFGEALGRFALNPDLRPETTWQAEVGAAQRSPVLEASATVFVRRTADAIEQARLADGRRQRVNLGGSRALGIEGAATARRGALRIDATATALYLRGDTPDGAVRLPERPAFLARLGAVRLPPTGWTVAGEAIGTGPAVSLGPDGLLDLPASLVLGARLGHRWRVGPGVLGAFVRVDNALDAVALPQAGLPAPGREWRAGLRWQG